MIIKVNILIINKFLIRLEVIANTCFKDITEAINYSRKQIQEKERWKTR